MKFYRDQIPSHLLKYFKREMEPLILRNDVIWAKCLSGGTKLYAKTSKGTFPQPVKDLARLNNVELWTGKKWSKVRGFYENKDYKNPLEIELRSGEKIACTREHRFPTQRGLVRADELKIGDKLIRTTLPDNDTKNNIINNKLVAWFVGLYLAEGSRSDKVIQIASHSNEKERYEKCKKVASLFDGTCNKYDTSNNGSTINLSGIMLNAIIDKFIAGRTAKDKHLSTDAWQQRNDFLRTLLLSYLDADAHFDKPNDRYRLGFTDNIQLVNDLRTICARLGYDIRVKRHIFKIKDKEYPGYRGQIRFSASEHSNEIVKIGKSNGRKFWDIEIEDEPHLFALASGILTHNSNGMPESVTDRFSKKHEFFFFFVKQQKYYFDLDGVRDKLSEATFIRSKYAFNPSKSKEYGFDENSQSNYSKKLLSGEVNGKNPGDVSDFWDKSKSYPNRKYFFRENYFENIDSEDKAYWLGFIWADGYLSKDSLEIEIHIKDKDHLVEFQEDLCDNHKLYDRERQTTHSCRLTLGSQKLISDLVNLGYKNKLVPINLPEQLERHFIRGLFDGDGSVGFYKGRESQVRHWLEFLGKYDLMVWVAKRLKSIGMFDQIPKENKGTFRLSYVDDDAVLFYNYVYLGYSRCLERKKCRFPQELNYEFDFFDIPTQPSSEKHYATYNFDLIDKPIIAGCPKDGIILDPFCGTGTTIARAIQLGRNGIGIDGKQEYCEIAEKRIKQELSQLKLPI